MTLIIEQGNEINKDGRVYVYVKQEERLDIPISGTAVFVKNMEIGIK